MRVLVSLGVVVLSIGLVALWLFAPVEPVAAQFGPEDCRRVDLTDRATGAPIRGAEDLALLPDGQRIVLAAHDRSDPTRPDGGLYILGLWALRSVSSLELENLVPVARRSRPFRPHGIAVSDDGRRLALVNRPAPRSAEIEIGDLTRRGWLFQNRITGAALCRANDVDFVQNQRETEALTVTLDRAHCGPSIGDLLPGSTTGRMALWDDGGFRIIRDGLAFPNGLSGGYVAETRKNRVLRPRGEPIRLPGGPDNITRIDRTNLLIAVHPSLRRLWLYLNGILPTAPSRIVRAHVLTSEVEVLFDDPQGAIFSGATSAILTEDLLVAGSVGDQGLLVCLRAPS